MNWKPKTIINIGFLIRTINSFNNGFFGGSLGADADSISFHYRASNPWYNPDRFQLFRYDGVLIDGSYLYVKFLQNIYDFTVDHLFIGSFLSSVFWYFGALILLKSVNILNVNIYNKKTIFFFYSFLPSTILYTTTTKGTFSIIFY